MWAVGRWCGLVGVAERGRGSSWWLPGGGGEERVELRLKLDEE